MDCVAAADDCLSGPANQETYSMLAKAASCKMSDVHDIAVPYFFLRVPFHATPCGPGCMCCSGAHSIIQGSDSSRGGNVLPFFVRKKKRKKNFRAVCSLRLGHVSQVSRVVKDDPHIGRLGTPR